HGNRIMSSLIYEHLSKVLASFTHNFELRCKGLSLRTYGDCCEFWRYKHDRRLIVLD
ncbi:hypothetical protein L9F63_016550, partial [Diploptera punctata]